MTEQSNGSHPPPTFWLLIAVAVAAMIGVFASMATSLAIRDLRALQHQIVDQLKALQETVSSDRADMKRLSDDVAALNAKFDVLQQPFASARPQISPPSAPPPAPTGQKRGTR
jgi:outer membrane murein-binding lipoprotein Lpp